MIIDNIVNKDINGNAANVNEKSIYNNLTATKSSSKEAVKVSSSNSVDMSDTVYSKPLNSNETVADELMQDGATDRENKRNQMIVISNTTSAEDYKRISEDGFSYDEMTGNTIVTETDKIKAVLAKAGVDVSIYGDDLSQEQIEEITGNPAVAAEIIKQMQSYDIPVTDENLKESVTAVENGVQINEIDDNTAAYMVKNNLDPTVENIYKALYSSSGIAKEDTISDEEFDSMSSQIKDIMKNAKIDVNDENLTDVRMLMEKGISITADNIRYFEALKNFSGKDTEYIADSAAEAVAEGKRPMDAMLIDGFSLADQAKEAENIIQSAIPEDIVDLVNKNVPVTLKNLKDVRNSRTDDSKIFIHKTDNAPINIVSAQRKLEEARLAMSAEANLSLLKKGISIDTKPIEELVDILKQHEKDYYSNLMTQNGVEPTVENIDTFKSTMDVFEAMKTFPAYVINTETGNEDVSTVYTRGASLKTSMENANESYETLMTAPRSDMGDDIKKAFRNVDNILDDLGYEKVPQNQRAVRILGYNGIEITPENIDKIKAADENVQRAFKNMTPAVTLEMIRKGISPLDMSISQLNEAATEIRSQISTRDDSKFSEFLWKLEKNNEITEDERTTYIGIYRLIAQVEKSDGAVIGSLVNQGADITMKNLLSAVRTSNKKNVDYKVDDDFSGVDAKFNGVKIDDQINAAYNKNCIQDVMEDISPEKLMDVLKQNWEDMTPEQFKEALNRAEENKELSEQYAQNQLDEFKNAVRTEESVYQMLDRYDVKTNMVNLMAASRILKNPGKMVSDLFENGEIEMIRQLKEQVLEQFGEALKTPEEMAEAQEQLADVATHAMDSMIIESDNITSINLKELKVLGKQFEISAKMAKSESYVIPMETSDGSVTGINLKIVRGKEEKGFVDIFFNDKMSGKVAASFEVRDNGVSGVIAVSDAQTQKAVSGNISLFTDSLSETENSIDIKVVRVVDISAEKYLKTSFQKEDKVSSENTKDRNNVQTKRLYQVAEGFIDNIRKIFGPDNL